MNILAGLDICTATNLNPLWNVVGTVVKIIWIGIPILMILFGSIDLGKAVISSKEEEVKKAKKAFINRLIYAVLVFAVVWIVGVLINFVSTLGVDEDENGNKMIADVTGWKACWNKIIG